MFKSLWKFFRSSDVEWKVEQRQRGYDYAKGEIEKTKTLKEIHETVLRLEIEADGFDSGIHPFDQGISDFLRNFTPPKVVPVARTPLKKSSGVRIGLMRLVTSGYGKNTM